MSAEDAVADLLTLKSLRTLAAVARAGSLTRAASELGLAQSAVSRQLGELERAGLVTSTKEGRVRTYRIARTA